MIAGLAMAQVQSANTVGFQTDTTVAGFNWYCPPFATVGETGTITYGDITLEGDDVAVYGDNIQILDELGSPAAQFLWAGDGWLDAGGYVSGGYMTDEVIARGTAFIIETEAAGAAITCSGEVSTNAIAFTASSAAGFNWIGNPFPKAITYGDITLEGDDVAVYGDNIQILDELGSPAAQFLWAGDGWLDAGGYVSGGYMTDEPISAGAGFIIETEAAGATITISGFNL